MQVLYEKKLCTYPRTDSRYLTEDMAAGLPALVSSVAAVLPFTKGLPVPVSAGQVIDNAGVSDHHAVIPTPTMAGANLSTLPAGERTVLHMIAVRLICAVGDKHQYAETVIALDCAGHSFTVKGKTVLSPGWKAVEQAYRATLKSAPEDEKDGDTKALPVLTEGQTFETAHAAVKEGKTGPPKYFTEDTLLSAMETAGAEDMPEDAERKGLGTPATRAGIIEKLVRTGFLERRAVKKACHLLPTQTGVALATILPETLKSPALTAEWEEQLKQVERGTLAATGFMADIDAMTRELVQTYEPDKSALFPSDRESVGSCPRCNGCVTEGEKGFSCENRSCGFVLWKDNRFFAAKKKELTRKIVAALLKDGRVELPGCYSEKTGKIYDAVVVLPDTGGQHVNFKLESANKGAKRHER